MTDKQIQKAGSGAQQLQAETMIINVGIDEKRAREIYQEMNLQLRREYSREAFEIATSRVTAFESRLMPKMEAVDGALEAFSDPSFQLLLVEAQKTAASTERPADYDLLAELLLHRFQKGENRVTRAGICRAVEIVDKISDDALLGLTVFHSVMFFRPASGEIIQGLKILNDLFGKIIYGNLPVGNDWLDHLDILDAIRINSIGSLKKIEKIYPEMLAGYLELGIEKESENYNKALDLLENNGLPQNILVAHALNSDFVRMDIQNREQVDSTYLQGQNVQNGQLSILNIPLNETQKTALKSIYDLYKQDSAIKQKNITQFMVEWDKLPNLKKLRDWWDKLSFSIQITSVGRVLAHSNAQRCDKNLPPLN